MHHIEIALSEGVIFGNSSMLFLGLDSDCYER